MAKSNMGIADAEFTAAAAKISGYAGDLIEMINEYQQAVQLICETAIQDQLITAKLMGLCQKVEALKEPLGTISAQIAKDCQSYIDEIDQADQFLY